MQTNCLKIPCKLALDNLQNSPKKIFLPHSQEQKDSHKNIDVASLCQSHQPLLKNQKYHHHFVKCVLLIKINSLASFPGSINSVVLSKLVQLYNQQGIIDIYIGRSQPQFFSQILVMIQEKVYISKSDFENIIQGNSLQAASAVWLLLKSKKFLKKQEIGFSLSFLALGGRSAAFTKIVHEEKNHKGQINFADIIRRLVQVEIPHNLDKKQTKVQDPYSIRCSPQVYGISYDCFQNLLFNLSQLINKPHFRYVHIDGKKLPNILLQSDEFSLKLDSLINCIQQIGATIHLRSERILNKFLGKNNLHQQDLYQNLSSMLSSSIFRTSKNKLLCQMTNSDTMNISNYEIDIFFNSGSYYNKIEELFENMNFLLTLQILCSLQCLKQLYGDSLEKIRFNSEQMKMNSEFLRQNLSAKDRSRSIQIVRDEWVC